MCVRYLAITTNFNGTQWRVLAGGPQAFRIELNIQAEVFFFLSQDHAEIFLKMLRKNAFSSAQQDSRSQGHNIDGNMH